jgi:hypothetical protein
MHSPSSTPSASKKRLNLMSEVPKAGPGLLSPPPGHDAGARKGRRTFQARGEVALRRCRPTGSGRRGAVHCGGVNGGFRD